MASLPSPLKSLWMLTRPRLSAGVALVTAAVYVYYRHAADTQALSVAAAVFLLSCAASVLNQYQERASDALMDRTRFRPFATGTPGVGHILAAAAGTGAAGLTILFTGAGAAAALLGLAAVVVYNGIYTPAKRRTPFALLPGAVAGALPALIGCAAATGRIDAKAVFIAAFAFVWQIPHFLQLSRKFTDDYARAGLPTLPESATTDRLRIITTLWMLAACGAAALFPAARVIKSVPLAGVLMLSTIAMLLPVVGCAFRRAGGVPGWVLHAYQGVVMALLAAQGLMGG